MDAHTIARLKKTGVIKIRGTLPRADAARLNAAMEQEMRTCLGVDPSNPATYEFVYDLADPKAFTLGGVQEMYYTHAQFEARAHPQMLKVRVWLNKIWDFVSDPHDADSDTDSARSECLYLPEAELCYVDRCRHIYTYIYIYIYMYMYIYLCIYM